MRQAGAAWTVGDIIAAAAWREAVLSDCSLSFVESTFVADKGKPLEECYRKEVQMYRRTGQTMFAASKRYLVTKPRQTDEWKESWDGKICRGVYKTTLGDKVGETMGGICERMPPLFDDQSSCLMALNLSPKESLSEKLKRMIDVRQATPLVSISEVDGEPVVTLKLSDPKKGPPSPTIWEFSFLPTKDFIMIHTRCQVHFPCTQGKLLPVCEQDAKDLQQIDGLWMPMRIVEQRWMFSGEHLERLDTYDWFDSRLTSFSRAKPSDEQMQISFATNTLVVDSLARQAYRIMADGSRKYEPLLDPATGQIIQPPAPSTRPAQAPAGDR